MGLDLLFTGDNGEHSDTDPLNRVALRQGAGLPPPAA